MYRVSVVVPVYQGEKTLDALLAELEPLTREPSTPAGRRFVLTEVILVHDGAIDGSAAVITQLASRYAFVRPVWLSRNFGQHPATLAGMSSSAGDWVVTLDEDGQHNPADVGALLDCALEKDSALVYGTPRTPAKHPFWRNATSGLAKWALAKMVGSQQMRTIASFRLMRGDVARSLAAYCGQGVYLDVALSWVVGRSAVVPVEYREERGRPSGYSSTALLGHFWRMVLTSGTRPLRTVAYLGFFAILLGFGITAYVIWAKVMQQVPVQGWTSLMIVVCVFSGAILFSLGIIAEFLSMTLTMAMGKPLYLIVSRPAGGRER